MISTAVRSAIDRSLQRIGASWRPLALTAGSAVALLYLATHDPHGRESMLPPCPTKLVSGLDCPACGGIRLAYDVLHGDVRAALHDNAFLLLSSPVLVTVALRSLRANDRVDDRTAYALAAAGVFWMLVRNLPGWPLKPDSRG